MIERMMWHDESSIIANIADFEYNFVYIDNTLAGSPSMLLNMPFRCVFECVGENVKIKIEL